MRGAHIVATCWFTVHFFTVVTGQSNEEENTTQRLPGSNEKERVPGSNEEVTTTSPPSVDIGPHSSESEETTRDHHTFVALIDIVFADGSKRTCTGSIIHDYVVITAAHCFVKEATTPELTLSFIVIGTKRMFESGYEQYLPIERYRLHPEFKGWTADLALVYTFAAMSSDKSGKVQQFEHDKIKDPSDATFTVLSWGQKSDEFDFEATTDCNNNKKIHRSRQLEEGIHATYMRVSRKTTTDMRVGTARIFQVESSRYLTPPDRFRDRTKKRKTASKTRYRETRRLRDPVKAHYSNWRRRMGYQQNNLTVMETFTLVTFERCKRLVELVMPPIYDIKDENYVVCYTSNAYKITTEDLGAPAIRRGRLLAVTVGGVEADGQQMAIGMRVACFCPWIVANLPSGPNKIKCSNHFCDSPSKMMRKGLKKHV